LTDLYGERQYLQSDHDGLWKQNYTKWGWGWTVVDNSENQDQVFTPSSKNCKDCLGTWHYDGSWNWSALNYDGISTGRYYHDWPVNVYHYDLGAPQADDDNHYAWSGLLQRLDAAPNGAGGDYA
jgi:hypothetical protein